MSWQHMQRDLVLLCRHFAFGKLVPGTAIRVASDCAACCAIPCSSCPCWTLWPQFRSILHLLSCADESAARVNVAML